MRIMGCLRTRTALSGSEWYRTNHESTIRYHTLPRYPAGVNTVSHTVTVPLPGTVNLKGTCNG